MGERQGLYRKVEKLIVFTEHSEDRMKERLGLETKEPIIDDFCDSIYRMTYKINTEIYQLRWRLGSYKFSIDNWLICLRTVENINYDDKYKNKILRWRFNKYQNFTRAEVQDFIDNLYNKYLLVKKEKWEN